MKTGESFLNYFFCLTKMYSEKVHFGTGMEKLIHCDETRNRPAPSSPRQFFQRLYGHLEDNEKLGDVKNKSDIEIENLNSDSSCSEHSSGLGPDDEFHANEKVVDNRCAQITSNYMDASVGNFPMTLNTLSPAPSSTSSTTPLPVMPQHFSGSLRTIGDLSSDYHQTVFPPGLSAFRKYINYKIKRC